MQISYPFALTSTVLSAVQFLFSFVLAICFGLWKESYEHEVDELFEQVNGQLEFEELFSDSGVAIVIDEDSVSICVITIMSSIYWFIIFLKNDNK